MTSPGLRLRSGVRTVIAGERDAILVGGPRVLRLSGAGVGEDLLSLLRLLDGSRSGQQILSLARASGSIRAAGLLVELQKADLLTSTRKELREPTSFRAFVSRFANPEEPRHLVSDDRLTIEFHCTDETLARSIRATICRLGLGVSEPQAKVGTEASSALVATRIQGLDVRICEESSCWSTDHGSSRLMRLSVDGKAPRSSSELEVTAGLIVHWTVLVASGVVQPPPQDFDPLVRVAFLNQARFLSPVPPPTSRPRTADSTVIRDICRTAVGAQKDGSSIRWISPSAGGLRSTDLVIQRHGEKGPSIWRYNAMADDFECLDSPQAHPSPASQAADRSTLFFVAGARRLQDRYGALAGRLAHYDAGFALHHAIVAARSCGVGRSRPIFGSPEEDDATVWLGRFARGSVACALRLLGPGSAAVTSRRSSELVALSRRRSIRNFSQTPNGPASLERLDRALTKTIRQLEEFGASLTACRFGRGEHDRSPPEWRAGATPSKLFWNKGFHGLDVREVISQTDLSQAHVAYVFLHPEAFNDRELAAHATAAGFACSALWTAATRLGWVGAPFGGVRLRDGKQARDYVGLALCLGPPPD